MPSPDDEDPRPSGRPCSSNRLGSSSTSSSSSPSSPSLLRRDEELTTATDDNVSGAMRSSSLGASLSFFLPLSDAFSRCRTSVADDLGDMGANPTDLCCWAGAATGTTAAASASGSRSDSGVVGVSGVTGLSSRLRERGGLSVRREEPPRRGLAARSGLESSRACLVSGFALSRCESSLKS
jgi:hypothetical protein